LTSKLLTTFKQKIRDLKLIPSGGGCFEVSVNGELIYSKLQTGKFPDEQAMLDAVGERLKGRPPAPPKKK
jgi:selenoprotein W-related protein